MYAAFVQFGCEVPEAEWPESVKAIYDKYVPEDCRGRHADYVWMNAGVHPEEALLPILKVFKAAGIRLDLQVFETVPDECLSTDDIDEIQKRVGVIESNRLPHNEREAFLKSSVINDSSDE
jgi:hypothetical protein